MRTVAINYYPIVLFLSLTFLLSACTKGLKKVEQINESSGIKEIYYIDQDSLMQGYKLVYLAAGEELLEKAEYQNGVLHGIREIYFANGGVEVRESYDEGQLDDTLFVYYPSGEVKLKMPYSRGELNGHILQHYESGALKEDVTYVANQENGPFKEYHENGQLKWKGQYLNGDNEFGLLEEYNQNGQLIKKMQCDSLAICRTIWTIEKGDIVPL